MGAGPPRSGRAEWACFTRQTEAGKLTGHQLASSTDLPTKASFLANGTYRLMISPKNLPAHTSSNRPFRSTFLSEASKELRGPCVRCHRTFGVLSSQQRQLLQRKHTGCCDPAMKKHHRDGHKPDHCHQTSSSLSYSSVVLTAPTLRPPLPSRNHLC